MPDLGGLINGLTTMLISLAFGGINRSLIVAEAPGSHAIFAMPQGQSILVTAAASTAERA